MKKYQYNGKTYELIISSDDDNCSLCDLKNSKGCNPDLCTLTMNNFLVMCHWQEVKE